MRQAVLALGLLAGCAADDPATQAHPFDGRWEATVTCTTAPDGAGGYTYRFPAEIRESRFRGENAREGSPNWLLLRGPIQRDGQAVLAAEGLTGAAPTTLGNLPPSTPYRYTARVQFQPRSGSGRRVEARPCTLDFVKL